MRTLVALLVGLGAGALLGAALAASHLAGIGDVRGDWAVPLLLATGAGAGVIGVAMPLATGAQGWPAAIDSGTLTGLAVPVVLANLAGTAWPTGTWLTWSAAAGLEVVRIVASQTVGVLMAGGLLAAIALALLGLWLVRIAVVVLLPGALIAAGLDGLTVVGLGAALALALPAHAAFHALAPIRRAAR